MSHDMPSIRNLFFPTIEALRTLGGHATGRQVAERVIADLRLEGVQLELTEEQPGRPKTRLEERLSWSRSYLKSFGVADNPTKGSWKLTDLGWTVRQDQIADLVRARRLEDKHRKRAKRAVEPQAADRLARIEVWIEWNRAELSGLATRIAELESKLSETNG
jgi:restriction system protein